MKTMKDLDPIALANRRAKGKRPTPTKVNDLMKLLKKSLEQHGKAA